VLKTHESGEKNRGKGEREKSREKKTRQKIDYRRGGQKHQRKCVGFVWEFQLTAMKTVNSWGNLCGGRPGKSD